jgi:dynactin 5
MADVHLRGDLTRTKASDPKAAPAKPQAITSISIGKQTVIATGSVIKPPGRISRGVWTYYPMKIGDNVFIGKSHTLLSSIICSPYSPAFFSMPA